MLADYMTMRLEELKAQYAQLSEGIGATHLDEFQRGMYAGRMIEINTEIRNYTLMLEEVARIK